jgi:cytochrome b subunit of formate dehydrogenase
MCAAHLFGFVPSELMLVRTCSWLMAFSSLKLLKAGLGLVYLSFLLLAMEIGLQVIMIV